MAEQFKKAGYNPGIISRGFGGNCQGEVHIDSNPTDMGDEPVLIAQRTLCPVFVGSDRISVGQMLLRAFPQCDVIISDDGLQHYRLMRDVELAVVDSQRLFGNSCLLPAGPLREPVKRLNRVDAIVVNGDTIKIEHAFTMQMQGSQLINVANKHIFASATHFQNKNVLAVAGIGNPQRFFEQLNKIGIDCHTQTYPDHYIFQAIDFDNIEAEIILMSEKDAVKCREFCKGELAIKMWYLPVNAVLTEGEKLMQRILNKIDNPRKGK